MKTNNTHSNRIYKNLLYCFVLFITHHVTAADKSGRLLNSRAVATEFRQTAAPTKKGETLGTPFRLKSEQTKLVTAIAKKVTEDKDDLEVCIYLYFQFLFQNCSIYNF